MTSKFTKEVRKQVRFAVAAAIGFIIAYAWKDYLLGVVGNLFDGFFVAMPNMSRFASAVLITIIGTIFILISSRVLE